MQVGLGEGGDYDGMNCDMSMMNRKKIMNATWNEMKKVA